MMGEIHNLTHNYKTSHDQIKELKSKKKINKRNNVCAGGLGSDLVATGPLTWAN